jgi:hypothetical protein
MNTIIGNFIRILNYEESIYLNQAQEIIRQILIFYQTGFNFTSFDKSFFYSIAKNSHFINNVYA